MSRKKKHKHEEHIDESWLLPYSDLLTLLVALFIVLFASSNVDVVKFKQMAQSFQSSFNGGTGVLQYPSPLPQEQMQSLNKQDGKNKNNEQPELEEELQQLQSKMDAYIETNKLNVELKTAMSDEGLMLTLTNDILFESGTANLRPNDLQLAQEISKLLVMDPPREIVVSGHTDNVPIGSAAFDSNWHLSAMRAINFMKILLDNKDLDPRWFSAKGFGEYKPVASNATPEGRMANRRVEILIKVRTAETDELAETQIPLESIHELTEVQ